MDPEIEQLIDSIEKQLTKGGLDLGNIQSLKKKLFGKFSQANFPRKGDKIYAKYFKHQYFPATIDSFNPVDQVFHITWDDGDTEGRVVAVGDVANDRIPAVNSIGVGSNVLFAQGFYGAKGDKFSGSRWHMGKITNVKKQPNGSTLYDGQHAFGEKDGKWVTYTNYSETFSDLKLEDLRVSPNALDAFGSDNKSTTSNKKVGTFDVFVCYSDANTKNNNKENINPIKVIQDIEDNLKVKTNLKVRNPSLSDVATMIANAKVFIAFISNEFAEDEKCQQQFQFAKKSKGIPVIPVVVGQDFDWTRTVVGLLIAGELYIHFKDESTYKQKIQELKFSSQKSLKASETQTETTNNAPKQEELCEGFISYCWTNSLTSKMANEVGDVRGHELADPRKVKQDLEEKLEGRKLWLDVEQLGTSNQSEGNASMFEQIANGLANTKVILTFISSEYSKSANCNMEFNHAVKTMRIPTIPIIVGEKTSDEWLKTQVGMVLGEIEARGKDSERIDLRGVKSEADYKKMIELICSRVSNLAPKGGKKMSFKDAGKKAVNSMISRAPKIGDHVISHWQKGQFFFSTIVSFDRDSLCFTVDWDDGDTTGRVVKYNECAKDVQVEVSDVGVGTKVLFPQGEYTLDGKYGGFRYFEGEVTDIAVEDGVSYYSGQHSRYDKSAVPKFRGVQFQFNRYQLHQLRLAPNAFDVLQI
ncbi:uncharacterized protein LOC142338555 [Convolutriloba macropyga]|uniref:uncharacterized protein LOC142338555 n=1 Tax=Convolutriloba macropyga TaxID=536237 RepID=UPI003F528687